MWERVYIPGFEAWREANQTSLYVKQRDTVPTPEAEDGVLKLALVHNIPPAKRPCPSSGARGSTSAASCNSVSRRTSSADCSASGSSCRPRRGTPQDAEVTAALSALYGTGSFGAASESLWSWRRLPGDLARL